jgi:hypothetical protein
MTRKRYEITAFRTALSTYLVARGWTGITYRERFPTEAQVVVPMVAITFTQPSRKTALQIGGSTEQLYRRVVQVDCFMENGERAEDISDDIMDFMDLEAITISDKMTNQNVGTLICYDTETIFADVVPPDLEIEKVNRWRAIVRGNYEAHYF